MTRLVSRIYEMASPTRPLGEEERQRNLDARRDAWHLHGLVVIDPEDVNDDWLRQAIINEGNRRYGRRSR